MKNKLLISAAVAATLMSTSIVYADSPSSFGSGFDIQRFYMPFSLKDITPENMQKWPYYKHVSAHWDEYAIHGTEKLSRSTTPTNLLIATDDETMDLNVEWKDGQSFIESLLTTEVKAFVVMKGNKILAEFYDNGFTLDDTQLLQSASKTIAGVIGGALGR